MYVSLSFISIYIEVRAFGRSGQKVYHSYYMAIEDPFEIGNNAGRTVKSTMQQEVIQLPLFYPFIFSINGGLTDQI